MSEAEEAVEGAEEEAPKKKSKLPLILGLVGALVLGGGGFYAVYSGLLLGGAEGSAPEDHAEAGDTQTAVLALPEVAYVPIDPLIISLGPRGSDKHLRFRATLEVDPTYEEDVTRLVPRVLDVLNSYLRAVDMHDIEDPGALVNLRAQMLRRIQLVTGEGRVRDLLVMEFVLN